MLGLIMTRIYSTDGWLISQYEDTKVLHTHFSYRLTITTFLYILVRVIKLVGGNLLLEHFLTHDERIKK